jgi:hypothetical protein
MKYYVSTITCLDTLATDVSSAGDIARCLEAVNLYPETFAEKRIRS